MKRQSFRKRFGYALSGVKSAFRSEVSFRLECGGAVAAGILLLILRPAPLWWALVALTTGLVLSLELVNTALEALLDRLHPDKHPLIAKAKDCAAAAVLVASLVSLVVAGGLIWSTIQNSGCTTHAVCAPPVWN